MLFRSRIPAFQAGRVGSIPITRSNALIAQLDMGFDALFTFIYSPRPGTKAAAMPDPASREEKQKWFDKLLEVQNAMSARLHAAYVGKTVRVLVDGESDDPDFPLASRTEGNRLVRLKGDKSLIGRFIDVKVTDSNTWALYGEPV